jgi:hypothetical protein
MGGLWPPSLPEWHASVVGFGAGFAFGAADGDRGVSRAFTRAVFVVDHDAGHLGHLDDEAAYAAACFVLGSVVGSRFDTVTSNEPG